jgi:hypothetical protein
VLEEATLVVADDVTDVVLIEAENGEWVKPLDA